MPIPEPNLFPPCNILRFGYAELGVSDLEAAEDFYGGIFGLTVSGRENDSLYFRGMEERGFFSLKLTRSQSPEALALGFRVYDRSDLQVIETFAKERELDHRWSAKPHLGQVLRVRDPWGVPLEFYSEMERLPTLHQHYRLYRGVKPLRIDHTNLFSTDVDTAVGFFGELGFRITEYTEDKESGRLWAAWMHRKGTVHDIAFTNGVGPRLHHIAYWVSSPMNIIDLLDIMSTTGHLEKIERGPGRHGISNAFFLYLRDDDGHRTEVYCSDYQTIDPDHEPIGWDLKDPRRQTLWGAPAPRSWFEEGSTFTGTEPARPLMAGTPIVAT